MIVGVKPAVATGAKVYGEIVCLQAGGKMEIKRLLHVLFVGLAVGAACGQQAASIAGTQVVMLGTGTPLADPERSGPAVAIVVNGVAYLVDCGPGVVRRAAAAEKAGIKALAADKLKIVFITHLHSDHTLGYPDLIFSPLGAGAARTAGGVWAARVTKDDGAH